MKKKKDNKNTETKKNGENPSGNDRQLENIVEYGAGSYELIVGTEPSVYSKMLRANKQKRK